MMLMILQHVLWLSNMVVLTQTNQHHCPYPGIFRREQT
jgi:hypothetical protein